MSPANFSCNFKRHFPPKFRRRMKLIKLCTFNNPTVSPLKVKRTLQEQNLNDIITYLLLQIYCYKNT